MRATLTAALLPLLAQIMPAAGRLQPRELHQKLQKRFGMKSMELDDDHLEIVGNTTFEQLLDHSNPDAGTFSQRFWWNAEFYEEDGPIFLFNPGETSADGMLGYLTNKSLPGYYAQQLKGAVVVLEHRYWGKSVPFDELTAETLQYHNLPNAIADMTNFAQNVDCEFCEDGTCNSNENPWVLIGGSYSGALAAWTSQLDSGTFAAYHASSAVVEGIDDFWYYFSPIEDALPSNCSTDVRAVIQYVDTVLASGNADDISTLKTRFGLSALNDMDFADTLANPITLWQNDQDAVISFCDDLEASASNYTQYMSSSGSGVGLVAALEAYASYIKENEGCGTDGSNCDTWDDSIDWNDTSIDDTRAWQWMLCNEPFGWWQVGPPTSDGSNIVSSALRPEHFSRRCPLLFPETNGYVAGIVEGYTEDHLNAWTQGWDAPYSRVIFVNGEFDPWKTATVASPYRPDGPANSTDDSPKFVVEGGVHCPELWVDEDDDATWPIVQKSVEAMNGWLGEWSPPSKRSLRKARRQ
ncbi:peptidase S28 [Xylariaceae sp. FL0016]|nr:peptidase S28 [Xylariaceae sp. FL0016]